MDSTRELVQQASDRYERLFGEPPSVAVFAPGRVNLIGEHTDYNDGFVMPFAIPFKTVIVGSRTFGDAVTRINSTFTADNEVVAFEINTRLSKGTPTWANYVKGTIAQYVDDLPPNFAFNACIASDVPSGSGLSSSAALEVAVATFIEKLAGGLPSISGVQKALRCQRAEHVFADTPCGIMDQFVSAMGKQGNLLLIDCRTQDYSLIPFGNGADSPVIIVTNTKVKHDLSESAYPARVRACKDAVAVVRRKYSTVTALRDVTMAMLNECKEGMDDVTFRRARHAVTEDVRTLDTVKALAEGDFKRVGANMTASHASLRDDFEVSCEELDFLAATAVGVAGVHGSRMTGGGFGGCTVTLVARSAVSELVSTLETEYMRRFGWECLVYPAMSPSAGCGALPLDELISKAETNDSAAAALSWAVPLSVVAVAAVVCFVALRRK